MVVKNAKILPKVFYGLHMAPGVAEYQPPGKDPFRIFIGEDAIKKMDKTFEGRPVYVEHVDEVNLENIQAEADGYVTKSFYNKADGKHWVSFIIVSDNGHKALKNGWKLSNAYHLTEVTGGGSWHAVDYEKEILNGEYDHLAIVKNPRYEESIILTPEEFKEYNCKKENELLKLANSKEERPMFKIFKKQKLENEKEKEFAEMSVVLPKSKVEITIADLVTNADDEQVEKKEKIANGDHKVSVGEEKMTVNELVKNYLDLKNAKKKNEEDSSDDMENAEDEETEDKKKKKKEDEVEGDKQNSEDEGEEKEKSKEKEKAKNEADKKKENFEKLKNANEKSREDERPCIELSEDLIARGKSRYGSGK